MSLVTTADVAARLGRSLTAEEVSTFTEVNAANQAYLERVIGSKIEAADPTTRYYDGGVQHLSIDPCTDVTAVAYVDDYEAVNSTIGAYDYTLEPRNRTSKTMVRARAKFATGINNIAVTAKFSINADADALAVVKNALIELNAKAITYPKDKASESIEGYSVNYVNLTTLVNSLRDHPAIAAFYYLYPEL